MRELEQHLSAGIKTEITVEKKQEIEYVLEGTITPKNGHTLWEINELTGEIKKAEYKRDTATFNPLAKREPEKLVVNPDCVYIPSLNIENAKKKYDKDKRQTSYFDKEPPMKLSDITTFK